VLLECPYSGSPLQLVPAIKTLTDAGFVSLLAHPERNPDVIERPDRVAGLVELGVLIQVTAGSVVGQFGRPPRKTAAALLDVGLVHVLASDAHGPHIREGSLAAAAAAVGDVNLARYLTEEAPGAILAGEGVAPPLPRRKKRLGLF
jgi:protein-tyrosine phosphatase